MNISCLFFILIFLKKIDDSGYSLLIHNPNLSCNKNNDNKITVIVSIYVYMYINDRYMPPVYKHGNDVRIMFKKLN